MCVPKENIKIYKKKIYENELEYRMTGMHDEVGKNYPSTNKYFLGMQKNI